MDVITVCNLALQEAGLRVSIMSFQDETPAANAAALFFTPKVQMVLRGANWDCLRAQALLSQWKAAVVGGVASANPPPQPWLYSYLYPSDCLKARFIQPTLTASPPGVPLTTGPNLPLRGVTPPTGIPYVVATDFDAKNNPIKVILADVYQAQLIYLRDLSQVPDLWDSMLLAAVTAVLAAYFINALQRNKADYDSQIAIAKNLILDARAASGNESISTSDIPVDWISVRQGSAVPWALASQPGNIPLFEPVTMPGGLSF